MKKAMTVSGPVEADELGHILPHEHIFRDFQKPEIHTLYPELKDKKVTLEYLGKIRRDIWSCRDNLVLDDVDTAVSEAVSFKSKGGGTIIDVTSIGLKREVKSVKKVADASGINIIVSTGYYVHEMHPEKIKSLSIDEISYLMCGEIEDGIDGTGIKAGVIGEIGISSPMHPDEEKVLRAAAAAHLKTGAAIYVHQYGGKELKDIHNILAEEGINPSKVILCHMCSTSSETRIWAASQGYYIEIDSFGNEYYSDAAAGKITRDPDKIRMIKELISKGYLKQILVSNNVSLKILLKKYGGWGYEHIILNIKPFMIREGIPIKSIDTMIYYNPMRAVAYLD